MALKRARTTKSPILVSHLILSSTTAFISITFSEFARDPIPSLSISGFVSMTSLTGSTLRVPYRGCDVSDVCFFLSETIAAKSDCGSRVSGLGFRYLVIFCELLKIETGNTNYRWELMLSSSTLSEFNSITDGNLYDLIVLW